MEIIAIVAGVVRPAIQVALLLRGVMWKRKRKSEEHMAVIFKLVLILYYM